MGKVVGTVLLMVVGAIGFCIAILLMGFDMPRDGVLWLWNLSCTLLAVASMMMFFLPVFLFVSRDY